jgi:histidyl-tRNA synthetase
MTLRLRGVEVANLIAPRTLSGFRDYLPDVMLAREKVLDIARRVYRSYGFTPIDTPACEALDVLLGKGGDESDKLVYRVRSAKSEKEEMGLRFDLTVPFARFSAQYINQLGTPFKRYAMGPVWRGERPGQGRYREFWQCDFDTIGTTSNASDIETALIINDLLTAIGFEKFEVRINNRLILNGLLEALGIADKSVPVLRSLDKLLKVGAEAVKSELILLDEKDAHLLWALVSANLQAGDTAFTVICQGELRDAIGRGDLDLLLAPAFHETFNFASHQSSFDNPSISKFFYSRVVGISALAASAVLDLATAPGTNDEILEMLAKKVGANEKAAEGIRCLRELLAVAKALGVPEGRIKIDLSICRGLDYYTGTIYETFLTDLPGIGSVCSGGRYDNLASLYTKQVLPGVGASLGVDRLIAAMEELKHPLLTGQSTPAEVLVVNFDATRLGDYQRIARDLRASGVNVEVYPEAKKIGPQLGYAEKRGFKLAVIAGPAEFDVGVWKVKDLAKREEMTVPAAELVARVKALIG